MKEENPDELAGEIRRHVYGDTAVSVMDFYEPMTEGMRKLTEHLRDQGFKALVVLLDEITLLLRGRERDFQGRTLADMNRMLEHENAALPVWALVSRHIEALHRGEIQIEHGFRPRLCLKLQEMA